MSHPGEQGWQGGYPPYGQPYQPYQPYQPAPRDPRWDFPHEEPREYHQVLRTWTFRWWKPVLGVVLLLVGMLIVLPLVALPVLLVGVAIEDGTRDYAQSVYDAATVVKLTPSALLYLNVTLAGLVLWCWLLVRVLHHLRPRWLASVRPRIRWRFLLACLGMALVAVVLQVVVSALLPTGTGAGSSGGDPVSFTGTTLALALVVLLTTPFQCAGEEYAFRGYLLQAIGGLARNKWLSIVLTALLFACAHLQFDPPLFFDRFMFGLVAAWLVIRTGGLEAGIALHVLNNYLAFGFAILSGQLDAALDPGDVSWWNIVLTLTQSLSYAALVVWVARRMDVQRTTRPPHLEAAREAAGEGARGRREQVDEGRPFLV